MTTRVLPSSEWSRLEGTELEQLAKALDPERTRIVVVEREGQIVGTWAATTFVHLEGIWIHPDFRGRVSVGRRLLSATFRAAKELGARFVFTGALTDEVAEMIGRIGGDQLPGRWFVVPMSERT